MRLWSIHPCHLDAKGLVALWREGLLAQSVLLGNTKGYKNHPQLKRFRTNDDPLGAIASYLRYVVEEADRRGYKFNRDKISNRHIKNKIPVTNGQLDYEYQHLLGKLKERDPGSYKQLKMVKKIKPLPIFKKISGSVEEWEKI